MLDLFSWGLQILHFSMWDPVRWPGPGLAALGSESLSHWDTREVLDLVGFIRDMGRSLGRSPGWGRATHSRALAWRIPGTEEPGELQPIWSWRVRHHWSDLAHTHTHRPPRKIFPSQGCLFIYAFLKLSKPAENGLVSKVQWNIFYV